MILNKKAIIDDATQVQYCASDPDANVWVNASAGTGKTKVLTDRVLRLLLPSDDGRVGTKPQNILCLTFTKAGANEMITRVMKTLSIWAVCGEDSLVDHLSSLLGYHPTTTQIDTARQLFATIIDLPGGLNITTIHGFCQSVLGRFTIEAKLPPHFQVMEESESYAIMMQARDQMIDDILSGKASEDITASFDLISTEQNADQVTKILQNSIQYREALNAIAMDDYDDMAKTCLGVDGYESEDDIFNAFFNDTALNITNIKYVADALNQSSPTHQGYAKNLYAFCDADIDKRYELLSDYIDIFLKKDGDKRAYKSSKKLNDENVFAIIDDETNRLLHYRDSVKNIKIIQWSTALLRLTKDIIHRYDACKTQSKKLDYDDLIRHTLALFSDAIYPWVLYKMDYQIDHLLVDEAQDTSPDQWQIILAIAQEFYSGQTHRNDDINRTIFVVGDTKQSIFSFQGADPMAFDDVRVRLSRLISGAKKQLFEHPMQTSFRSNNAVLDVVDSAFQSDDLKQSLSLDARAYQPHKVARVGHGGTVTLLPPYKALASDNNKRPAWQLPIEIRDTVDANAALANRLAVMVRNMIDRGDVLPSTKRPVCAGDFMILVRSRSKLFNHMIKAFKNHKIPIAGADRLKVTTHIAVEDIMAMIRFALLPSDDLTLACVLKSPLIGWGDEQIEDVAYPRPKGGELWHALKNTRSGGDEGDQNVVAYLSSMIDSLSGVSAFDAVSHILNVKTPHGQMGWQAMIKRLGMDAIDPIEELLSMAQTHDSLHPHRGLQGFVNDIANNTSEIKREMEGASDRARIMTVHASKGLQAPIVIMPDTLSTLRPVGRSDDGFLWLDGLPFWAPSTSDYSTALNHVRDDMKQSAEDEYRRLLYVALTRAEDHLMIGGVLNGQQSSVRDGAWYDIVRHGLMHLGADETEWDIDLDFMHVKGQEAPLMYHYKTKGDDVVVKGGDGAQEDDVDMSLPDWVINPLPAEQYPPRILKPSQDNDGDDVAVRSPLDYQDDSYRYRRGLLTHSLLQYLPDIAVDEREHRAVTFLKTQAPDVSDKIKTEIVHEVMTVLNHPEFSQFFAPGSLAEIPVTGVVQRDDGKTDIISGQIDRMVISDDTVWIIDFKSNRPPPKDPSKIPVQYKRQLSAYKSMVRGMYPDHDIRCALLWTDGPFVSVLSDAT